jgi:hypothetical protein
VTDEFPQCSQDYLEGGRGSCNIFKDGDAAQLFSAPALEGSFVGIATGGRIMSSSSSKDIHKQGNARELHLGHNSNVSAHQGLSDNKDVNFEKESGSDSGESGSYGWADDHGDEAGVDGDTKSLLLQKWDQEDFILVEGALVQMLQKKSTSSSSKRLKQDGEGEGPKKSESGVLLQQTGGSEILDSQWDFELLSRLLHQVCASLRNIHVAKLKKKRMRTFSLHNLDNFLLMMIVTKKNELHPTGKICFSQF